MAQAVQLLRNQAKDTVGSGYTIHFARRRSRDWGEQDFPDRITIETSEDLIALVDGGEEFRKTQ